jgi:hypothetical protein
MNNRGEYIMKKLILIALLCWLLVGCNSSQNSANTDSNINVNGASGNVTTNANIINGNTNVNPNVAKATNNSPTRISFGKGQNWGTSNITLPASGTQRFIVSAKSGQTMDVEVSSKDTSVNLIKGKAQTEEDFGYLTAQLQANGDYVFEVENSTKKELKTSVKVTIEGGEPVAKAKDDKKKAAESEIDESDATVAEDEDALPPPTTPTPKKKED